ncbi:BMP family protein [Thermodesulfobacteriota bacterium]
MKRISCLVLIALFAVFTLFLSPALSKTIKVGLVTDVGTIDDKTFNEFAYKGMNRAAKDFDLTTAFIETQQPTDYDKNIGQFINEGYDVVVTVGFMLGDATKRMAERYPDKKFIIVDFAYNPTVKNIIGLVFAENESGFMAGALAGLMTKSNTIGIVGGMEIPPVIKFRIGYEAGAKYVNPNCEVLGVYIDSFVDPARGKTAALSQMEEGADVIFGAGGLTGTGGIQGAAAEGTWVIGVDQDEYDTSFKGGKVKGSEKLISSAMKRVDNAVYQSLQMVVEGKFKGGVKVFDITNAGIGLAPFHEAENKIPASVKERLKAIEKDLKAGKIKVPSL